MRLSLEPPALDAIQVLVRVARQDIALLCNLVASYEDMAVVRTLDAQQGLVELLVAPAFHPTALALLQSLTQEMSLSLLPSVALSPGDAQETNPTTAG